MKELTAKPIRPFSNGSQFGDWQACNCDHCTKGPQTPDEWPACPILAALLEAYVGDGKVTPEIADRMGLTENQGKYVWACGEVDWTPEWMRLQEKAGQQ